MSDLKDCITSAMADGHISRDAGAEYIERFDELAEAIGAGKSWFEAKSEAAVRLQRPGDAQRLAQRDLGGLVVSLCHRQHAQAAEDLRDVRVVLAHLFAPQAKRLAVEALRTLEVT